MYSILKKGYQTLQKSIGALERSHYLQGNRCRLIFLLVLFLFMSYSVSAATYYVSNSGNDTNNGLSEATPWKTLANVSSPNLGSGSVVLFKRGNIWRESILMYWQDNVSFGAYGSGAKPILDGADIITGLTDAGSNIWQKAGVTIKPNLMYLNHTIGNQKTSLAACTSVGDWYWDSATNAFSVYSTSNPSGNIELGQRKGLFATAWRNTFTISNLTIQHSNENNTAGSEDFGSGAIYGLGVDHISVTGCTIQENGMYGLQTINGSYITIDRNTFLRNGEDHHSGSNARIYSSTTGVSNVRFTNNQCNYSDVGLLLHGSNKTNKITNVDIHGNHFDFNSSAGLYIQMLDSVVVYDNNIDGNGNNHGIECYGIGITSCDNTDIYQNTITNQLYNDAIQLYSDNGAGYGSSNNVRIFSNYISGSQDDGIGLGLLENNSCQNLLIAYNTIVSSEYGINAFSGDGIASSVNIFNNTFYTNVLGGILVQDANFPIVLKNNIFVNNGTTDVLFRLTTTGLTTSNNIYFRTSGNVLSYNGHTFTTATIKGFEASAQNTDPLFMDAAHGDFSLKTGSPAINAGVDVGLTKDILGNSIVGNPDLGAYEFSSPVATSFTMTGPSTGSVNSASTDFTVTPNNPYTGTITITPTGIGSSGLSAKVLTFVNSSAAQNFTITPTVAGSIVLTATNTGTLTNPTNLNYRTNAILPGAPTSVVATFGDASATVTFTAPINNGGSAITGYTVTSIPSGGIDVNAGSNLLAHTISGLTNGTSYMFTVKATNSVGSSVASDVSNQVIPMAAGVIIKQGEIIPSHFTTVWQGLNGLNHMNINVVSAILEDIPLSVDDEIAVFSGSACVGASKLTESIVPTDHTTFLTILASQNDGSGNGFIDNDTIVFKIWKSKTQIELQVNAVIYRNDVPTWKTNGRYSPGATTVVEIASFPVYTQQIEILKGYNLISTYVSAQNPTISSVTKTLLDQGNLIKMQDENGNSFENWGTFGGWINQLGSMEETEGYQIQVANNCTLQVTGRSIAMPFDISLKTGWNIISYPRTDAVNAMNVVQALIDQNKLVKVQDEAGNSMENWGLFGGWKNGIGNLIPGKAYKVKMSDDAILTFQESYPKSVFVTVGSEQTEFYHSSVEGNGTDHMNINITDLNTIGLSAGDELAAFDGAVCVATSKITEANLKSGTACLVSSFSTDTQKPNGFKVGDSIQILAWNKLSGNESKINAEVITGQLNYEKNASVFVKMKSATLATGLSNLNDIVKIDVFPNPCRGKFTVRLSENPEQGSRIDVLDVSGHTVASRLISEPLEVFNLGNQPSGLYLIKTTIGSSQKNYKLIIN